MTFSELLLLELFKFDGLFSILDLSTFQISTGCSSAEATNPNNKVSMIEKFFLFNNLKIFIRNNCISFSGAGKSILLVKKQFQE